MNAKISVIIPIFNAEKYLEKTLNNYLNQSYDSIEYILVDDGSSDDSLRICKKFAKKYDMISVFHINNSGVSHARNYGIEHSTGEYIAFLDADDYIDYNFLEILVGIAEKYNLDIVSCGISMELEKKDGKILKQTELFYSVDDIIFDSKEKVTEKLLSIWIKSVPYNVVNKLYKKIFIQNNQLKFSKLHMGEDLEFNLKAFDACNNLGLTSRCSYHYIRERQGAATAKYIPNWFEIRLNEHEMIANHFKAINEDYILTHNLIEFENKRFVNRVLGCMENEFRDGAISNKRKANIRKMISNDIVQEAIRDCQQTSLYVKCMIVPIRIQNVEISYRMMRFLNLIKRSFPRVFEFFKYRR